MMLPKDATAADLSFQYLDKLFQAPVADGDLVSRVQVWSGGMCIAQTDLFAMNNVALRTGQEDNGQEKQNQLQVIWLVFLIIAVLAMLGFCVHKYRYVIQRFANSLRNHKRRTRRRRR